MSLYSIVQAAAVYLSDPFTPLWLTCSGVKSKRRKKVSQGIFAIKVWIAAVRPLDLASFEEETASAPR